MSSSPYKMRKLTRGVFSGGIVSLNIGPDEVPFDVHVELICDCFPYFDTLFADRFKATPTEPVSLPNVDPDVFTDCLTWVYQGTLKIWENNLPTWTRLCQLWTLGGILESTRFQGIIRRWSEIKSDNAKEILDETSICFIYENTPIDNFFRALAVDVWVKRHKEGQFSNHKSNLPREFIEDVCSKLLGEPGDVEANNDSELQPPRSKKMQRLSTEESVWKSDHGVDDLSVPASESQLSNRKLVIPKSKRRSRSTTPDSSSAEAQLPTVGSTVETPDNIASKLERLDV